MTSMYDEASPSLLAAMASQTEEQHQPKGGKPGRCSQCGPDGCERMEWAAGILAEYRRDRAAFLRRDS